MENLSREEILKVIIEDVEEDLSREEILHIILNKKVSENVLNQKPTFGTKAADNMARFAGSWKFIIGFAMVLAFWIIINTLVLKKAFDPFPFILLNLMLSCLAAIQAPIIMMSQNRQEEKDRDRAENDYKVNLKTEIIIKDIHNKLDTILNNQASIFEKLERYENNK